MPQVSRRSGQPLGVMAIYIPILLDSREGARLIYSYTQPQYAKVPVRADRLVEVGELRGLVCYDQNSGEFTHVLGSEWDDGACFKRVCAKLKKHFQSGEVPERTAYAA